MAALHNLYDFLDEFNEIFGEKAEYEIKSMLDNTITVKMIYKRALPPAQFQPDISNPFDNIAMEGIDSPDVYDRYATAEVKVECSGNGKVNFSAKIGDPSFPEILVSDKRLKRFLDAKTKFCGEFQQNADGSGVYVDIDADFVRATIEAGREQMRKLQYMIATHDDIDSLKYARGICWQHAKHWRNWRYWKKNIPEIYTTLFCVVLFLQRKILHIGYVKTKRKE